MAQAQTVTVSMRFEKKDAALVDALREKTGIKATSEVIRMALRALAQQQGVSVP